MACAGVGSESIDFRLIFKRGLPYGFMKCLITGVTGSGKSTVGKILKSKGYKVIEIDDEPGLAEWIHKNTGQIGEYKRGIGAKWVDEHEWLLNISKLRELLAKATQPTFVCGLTANQSR